MPVASSALMKRFRRVVRQLSRLERDLRDHGDREAADLLHRAIWEIEEGVRVGVFHIRDEDISDELSN